MALEYCRTLNFHGALYEVACECRDGARREAAALEGAPSWQITQDGHGEEAELVVDVECETGERWTGAFSADYIESLTSKTGNYKALGTFARMLSGALDGTADSVFVDLLTARDLEQLRARKRGAPAPSEAPLPSDRRYLIVTYAAEFDRVHYPLPLDAEAQPSRSSLQRQLRRCRARLQRAQPAPQQGGDEGQVEWAECARRLRAARAEAAQLRERVAQLERDKPRRGAPARSRTPRGRAAGTLRAENARLREELDARPSTAEGRTAARSVGVELEAERRKCAALRRDLAAARAECRRLRRARDASREAPPPALPARKSNVPKQRRSVSRRAPPPAPRRGRSPAPRASPAGAVWYAPHGRFDPTQYQRDREARLTALADRRGAWGSRSPSCGYSSAGSRRSERSCASRRSTRSAASRASSIPPPPPPKAAAPKRRAASRRASGSRPPRPPSRTRRETSAAADEARAAAAAGDRAVQRASPPPAPAAPAPVEPAPAPRAVRPAPAPYAPPPPAEPVPAAPSPPAVPPAPAPESVPREYLAAAAPPPTASTTAKMPPKKAALRRKESRSPPPPAKPKAPLRDRNAENAAPKDAVCDIDKRLNSLKAFLKEAKSKPL